MINNVKTAFIVGLVMNSPINNLKELSCRLNSISLKDIFSYLLPAKEQKECPIYNPGIHGDIVSFKPPSGFEEIERYWVDEPYSFISISSNTEEKSIIYNSIEPKLDKFEKLLLEELILILQDVLTLKGVSEIDKINNVDKYKILRENTKKILSDYPEIDISSFEKIYYYVKRNFIEYGEISPMMHDSYIEDVWCNGADIPIYVYHRAYGDIPTNICFGSDDELDSFVMRIAQQSGCHLSRSNPILDTVMCDGSRINITYGYEVSPKGSSFSIRRRKKIPLTPLDLIVWKTFSSEMMAYFWLCVENRKNILFCGGTASGKTSSLNAISMFIPMNIRIVSLEDTREIQLPHENWIPTVTRDAISGDEIGKVDLEDLLRASLRQRPEYLIVGEVRGRESQILFQAMNAGHATCSTFHAGSTSEVINRFTNPPLNVPSMMFSALGIICVQTNAFNISTEARRVSVISEIIGVKKQIETEDSFIWDSVNDSFEYKRSHVLTDIKQKRGWSTEELETELNQRKLFLESLIERGIRDYDSVVHWINTYSKDPEKATSLLTPVNRLKKEMEQPVQVGYLK